MMEIHYYNPQTGEYNNTEKYNDKTASKLTKELNKNPYVFYWHVKTYRFNEER